MLKNNTFRRILFVTLLSIGTLSHESKAWGPVSASVIVLGVSQWGYATHLTFRTDPTICAKIGSLVKAGLLCGTGTCCVVGGTVVWIVVPFI